MGQTILTNKLTKRQLYILRNLLLFPDMPLRAQEIFTFLQIPAEYQIEYFDALHDLVPEFLLYSNNFYTLPSDVAQKINLELEPHTDQTRDLIDFFREKFANADEDNLAGLKKLEPYVLSLFKNYTVPSLELADLYYHYANYCFLNKKHNKALDYAYEAARLVKILENKSPVLAKYYNLLGYLYWQKNDREKAGLFYKKTLDLLKNKDNLFPKLKFEANLVLADFHLKQAQYNTAIHFYLNGLELLDNFLSDESEYFHTYIYLKLAKCYEELFKYHKALYYITKAEFYNKKAKSEELEKIINYEHSLIRKLYAINQFFTKAKIYLLLALGAGISLGLFFIIKRLILK